MGLRGFLPNKTLRPAGKLASLEAPSWLTREGKAFWDRHAAYLDANELLTTATAESYANLCDLWACLRSYPQRDKGYLDLLKAFNPLAKLFRLQPVDKPGATTATRHEDKDAFDF